jgi:uncharacterized protein
MTIIGLISDTHGLLRPEAVNALRGCTLILHAGDVGDQAILDELSAIAPVTAVRGNMDTRLWARTLSLADTLEVDGVRIYLRHKIEDIRFDPAAAGMRVVVTGHSHRPRIRESHGVLFVNPGSAGPKRSSLPISVARLEIKHGHPRADLIELHPRHETK